MKLTTFFLNGSKQITNLDKSFFVDERKKDRILPQLDLEQKAKTTALHIAEEKYYNYHLDFDRLDLQTSFE